MALHQQRTEIQARLFASNAILDLQENSKTVQTRILAEILRAATKKDYDKAISLSRTHGTEDPDIVNARGVCLMRSGKYDEAVILFRNLVLQPGCTWMRKDRPPHFKCNFATALLMSGRPSGCLEMLHELAAEGTPTATTLRAAIKQWESALPFWKWLDWKFYGSSPSTQPVSIDFEPGDFGNEAIVRMAGLGGDQTTPPRNAA